MADQMAERMAAIEAWKEGHDKLCTEIRDDHREDMSELKKTAEINRKAFSDGLNRVHGRMDKQLWGIVGLVVLSLVGIALDIGTKGITP